MCPVCWLVGSVVPVCGEIPAAGVGAAAAVTAAASASVSELLCCTGALLTECAGRCYAPEHEYCKRPHYSLI